MRQGLVLGCATLLVVAAAPGLAGHVRFEIVDAWLDPAETPEGDVDPWLWDLGIVLRNVGVRTTHFVWYEVRDEPDHRYVASAEMLNEQGSHTFTDPGELLQLSTRLDTFGLVGPMSVTLHAYGADVYGPEPTPVFFADSLASGLPMGVWVGSACSDLAMNELAWNCVRTKRDRIEWDMADPWYGCVVVTVYTNEVREPNIHRLDPLTCLDV